MIQVFVKIPFPVLALKNNHGNHISNIFKKIGVFDRTQAAVYAIKNNIVEIY